MILSYYLLYEDLRRRNITVDFKNMLYNILDNTIVNKFHKVINKFNDLLNEFTETYEGDLWSCDDLALMLKALCGLHNFTCGYCEGRVYMDNEFYGNHTFNVIPYYLTGNLIWLVVEPLLIGVGGYPWFSVLPESSRFVALGKYIYEVTYIML